MQRRAIMSVAIGLALSAGALAQDGELSRVTMRVLDDLSDAKAVVLELDANRGESEEGAESDSRAASDAGSQDGDRAATRAEADEDARDLRRERDELHQDDADRDEGRREDRDVERPEPAPATP
jgi:hypothetical protein